MNRRRIAFVALLAFLAALVGVFVGRQFVTPPPQPGAELHAVLHDELRLEAGQERQLEALETAFALRRRALELEMRSENALLAEAITAEHGNGPRVTAAVDASHRTMGELQKETLAHIFAMRALLRPDQAVKFDVAVTKALTEDAR